MSTRRFLLLGSALCLLAGCPETGDTAGRKDPGLGAPDGLNTPDGVKPEGAECQPGATQCVGTNFLKCRDDGSDWDVTRCEEGQKCTPQGCAKAACLAGIPKCDDNGNVVVCLPDGSGYGPPAPCPQGQECKAGRCLPGICKEGTVECAQNSLLVCKGTPPKWVEIPCAEGQVCFKGECMECFDDTHCKDGMKCVSGKCIQPSLTVVTKELPDGVVGQTYEAKLEAQGGDGKYTWSAQGGVPKGLVLDQGGKLAGTPTEAGDFKVEVTVQDGTGMLASATLPLAIHTALAEVSITSKSPLPDGEEGTEYSYTLKAIGGVPPYIWGIISGNLPAGLTLGSNGVIFGTPTEPGTSDFTVRVFDSGEQTAKSSAPFKLTIKVAPLQIVGDQVINLFLTKAVILPLITVVEGIPIPYSTKLQAKGGVKPYHWSETEMPGVVKSFIPQAGIPDGLTLQDDGTLSGAVTKTSSVVELKVPFLNYTLTGFFFMARVQDSQSPPASDSAIFLIPTVPVNLGGGLPGGLPF